MKKLLKLNYEIIKKGERKGQLNTVKKKGSVTTNG